MAGRRAKGNGTVWYDPKRKKWRGKFEAGYTQSGGRKRISVSANTERACKARLLDRIKEYERSQVTVSHSDNITIKQWLDQWLPARQERVRPKTYVAEKTTLTKYVIPTLGKRRLKDVSTEDIRLLHKKMRESGVSATYVHYGQRILQQVLREAVEDGYTVPTPVLLMRRPPKALNDRTAMSIDEARAMVKTAYNLYGEPAKGVQDGTRWLAALLQGMRAGECLGLRWQDIDFDNNIIKIEWQLQEVPYKDKDMGTFALPENIPTVHLDGRFFLLPPKTKTGIRFIPLIAPMRDRLLEWRDIAPPNEYGLVWTRNDKGIPENRKSDLKGWKALQDMAGVRKNWETGQYYVLHEARNTTATLLLEAGVDPMIITSILGHTSIDTSRGYMRVYEDSKRVALEKAAGLLEG